MSTTLDHFRVLAHEDQAEFDQLLATCKHEFTPKTGHEAFLTGQMAQSRWRLDRARRFEAIAFNQLLTGEFDETNPDARIVAKLGEKIQDVLTFLHRQAVSAETSYYRAHRELTQGRSRELRNEANAAKHRVMQQLRADHAPAPPQPDPTRATPVSWYPHTMAGSDGATG